MVTRFEEETHELTDYEQTLVKAFVIGLGTKIGKNKIITNKEMETKMKAKGYKVNPARIRKIIHFIRVNKMVKNLVATNRGYYVATDKEDIIEYVKSLTERRNSINELINSYEI